MKRPRDWVRAHIEDLEPYTAARDLFKDGDRIFLDANESPYPSEPSPAIDGLERYPDPRCGELREALADWLEVEPNSLWIGNGSDEALDLIHRTFVEPGSAVAVCTPTYGMYAITARAHGARIIDIPLDDGFDLPSDTVGRAKGAAAIFLCSPNNPTGNRLAWDRVARTLDRFDGLVVLDEAYVEFSAEPSAVNRVAGYPNLAVLRTFSKAWGLAGARVGYMIADPRVVSYIDRINLPYPLSTPASALARRALTDPQAMRNRVERIVVERERLAARLEDLGFEVFPSDANFLLVRIEEAPRIFRKLAEDHRIVVRDRSGLPRLEDCLRITVGRPEENDRLCAALEEVRG